MGLEREPTDGDKAASLSAREIAQLLHDGILQDLTAAGLQLDALRRAPAESVVPKVAELASWLRQRQAALRNLVAIIAVAPPPRPDDGWRADVEALLPGCQVVWETDSAAFDPRLRLALTLLARALASPAPSVVRIAAPATGRLNVMHNGSPLKTRAKPSASVRHSIRELGGVLRIVRRGDVEILMVLPGTRR